MAEKGVLITAEDFTTLKKLVDGEITRRSNSASVGSMSAYSGSNYAYSTAPAQGGKIAHEHIRKITDPLDAVDGVTSTPEQGTMVFADTMKNALVKLNGFSSKSTTSPSTGCKSSCTGLCSTECYGACTGCGGTCEGGCKNDCKNSCSGDCGGCDGDCWDRCSGNCGDNCTGDCGSGCAGGCFVSCSGDCLRLSG